MASGRAMARSLSGTPFWSLGLGEGSFMVIGSPGFQSSRLPASIFHASISHASIVHGTDRRRNTWSGSEADCGRAIPLRMPPMPMAGRSGESSLLPLWPFCPWPCCGGYAPVAGGEIRRLAASSTRQVKVWVAIGVEQPLLKLQTDPYRDGINMNPGPRRGGLPTASNRQIAGFQFLQ